jgi:SAM-dependent methyltransferase
MKNPRIYQSETQSITLSPLPAEGFILDIGGGGEGIIGRLNGRQVVEVDRREQELQESRSDALKILMDATDLKFLPASFGLCTAFFSLMYMTPAQHEKVFAEAFKVLVSGGRFLLWDAMIPKRDPRFDAFCVRLRIRLPGSELETVYGTRWNKVQNLRYFKGLAVKCGFECADEWQEGGIFFLALAKK